MDECTGTCMYAWILMNVNAKGKGNDNGWWTRYGGVAII
jgi:hypothetical protein